MRLLASVAALGAAFAPLPATKLATRRAFGPFDFGGGKKVNAEDAVKLVETVEVVGKLPTAMEGLTPELDGLRKANALFNQGLISKDEIDEYATTLAAAKRKEVDEKEREATRAAEREAKAKAQTKAAARAVTGAVGGFAGFVGRGLAGAAGAAAGAAVEGAKGAAVAAATGAVEGVKAGTIAVGKGVVDVTLVRPAKAVGDAAFSVATAPVRAAEVAAQKAAAAPGEAAARLKAEAAAARAAADAAASKASAEAQESARQRKDDLEREATARVDDVKARVAAVTDAVVGAPDRVRDATTTAGRAAATLLRGAAAHVAAVGAAEVAAEAKEATVDMPAPPPTLAEWRAACDVSVASHYDFGVRETAAARRTQFTAQEPEDIFAGLAEDDVGARFATVVQQASRKVAAELPPLAKKTVTTTLRVRRRLPFNRRSFRGGPSSHARTDFKPTESNPGAPAPRSNESVARAPRHTCLSQVQRDGVVLGGGCSRGRREVGRGRRARGAPAAARRRPQAPGL